MKKEKPFAVRRQEFDKWHANNPLVWKYFEQFSFDALASGRKRISHWLIINRIRWEVYLTTTGVDYKLSNDVIAFYARLWRETYPQHKTLFKIKRMKGEPWFDEQDE
jgi:hypothetical protein